MLTYGYTLLYVPDVERALDFYVSAFGFTKKMLTPEKDYGEIDSGVTTIGFVCHELARSNIGDCYISSSVEDSPLGIELAFISDNLEKDFSHAISCGATIVLEPTMKPWGQTISYVRDLNGFLIELASHMGE